MAALRSLALLLAGLMVLHPGTGGAQTSPGSVLPAELRIFRLVRMTPLLDRTPEQITQDAFASEYGQAVVTETARVFETSADAECLRSNRIQAREWAKSAREIFLRYGAGFIHKFRNAADKRKFESIFAAKTSRDYKAEIARLRNDPDVKRFLELREPLMLAEVVEDTAEIVDRYSRLERIKLSASLYPPLSRSQAIIAAMPGDRSIGAIERFVRDRDTPQMQRWLALERAASEAWLESVNDQSVAPLLRPRELAAGLNKEFSAVCLRGGR